MKYTINVLLNRIDKKYLPEFEKAKQYYSNHGVDITFNFKDVNVNGYTSTLQSNAMGMKTYMLTGADKLVAIDPMVDATLFAFDMNEWATPLGSQFPLKPDVPSGSCILLKKPFMNVGISSYIPAWVTIVHEIMHSLVLSYRLQGGYIQDVMDSYLHNDNPDHPDGNFARQWKLLEPMIYPTLKEGMKSKDVLTLQVYLKGLGYFTHALTSYFGSITKQSVKDFQKDNGLIADGICGKNTWKALESKKKPLVEKIGKYQLYPLVERTRIAFIEACKAQGEDIKVTEGYRSFERQNELYNKRPKVTNAKGGQSFHNWGVSFDVCFTHTGYKGKWAKIGKIGKELGLEWGGDFKSIVDKPHFQMTLGYKLKDFQTNKVDFNKYA